MLAGRRLAYKRFLKFDYKSQVLCNVSLSCGHGMRSLVGVACERADVKAEKEKDRRELVLLAYYQPLMNDYNYSVLTARLPIGCGALNC